MLRASRSFPASCSCSRCSSGESTGSIGPALRPAPMRIGATLVTTSFAPKASARSAARSRARRAGSVSSNATTMVLSFIPSAYPVSFETSHAKRHVDPELLLGGCDRPERLTEVHARERGQVLRVDDVVRIAARLDAGGMVVQPDARDDLEGLAQAGRRLGLERTELLRRDEAVERARDRDAVREGVEAREIRDWDRAPLLEVEALLGQGPAETERRLEIRCAPREATQKVRMVPCVPQDPYELRRHLEPPGNRAEVERDVRPDQVGTVRRLQALAKDLGPVGRGHPPQRAAGEDVVGVGREAAALEAAVDVRRDSLEVTIDFRVPVRVGVGEGVLLVGAQRELTPGRAAESEPRPWNGGRPVRFEGEVEQPDRERVELER